MTERNVRYWRQLPPEQEEGLLLVLWLNAVVTLSLFGCSAVAVERAGARIWRHRGDGALGVVRLIPTPGLAVLAAVFLAHHLVRSVGMRVLDRRSSRYERGEESWREDS